MAEQQERETLSVWIGGPKNPLIVTKGSTGRAGMKTGKAKGTVFVECIIDENTKNQVEAIPEIAALIAGMKQEVETINIEVNTALANPNLPDNIRAEEEKKKASYIDWAKPIFKDDGKDANGQPNPKTYTPETNEAGIKLYEVKFKQQSIVKQLEAGTNLKKIIFVKHIIKNEQSGIFNKLLVDANNNPEPKQTFSGSEIAVRINTKAQKYPSENKFTLTMSRLVEIVHMVEGSSQGAAQVVGINPFGDTAYETETVVATTETKTETSEQPDGGAPASNPYAAPTDSTVPVNDAANPYANPSPDANAAAKVETPATTPAPITFSPDQIAAMSPEQRTALGIPDPATPNANPYANAQ